MNTFILILTYLLVVFGFLAIYHVILYCFAKFISNAFNDLSSDNGYYYSILNEKNVFIDDNTIKTYVVTDSNHDSLTVSKCLIDLNDNKIIIYTNTSMVLEKCNISLRKMKFNIREKMELDLYDLIKNSDNLNDNDRK